MVWYSVPDSLIVYESMVCATEFTISSRCLGASIPVSIAAVVPAENLGGNAFSAQSAGTLHLYSYILALCIMVHLCLYQFLCLCLMYVCVYYHSTKTTAYI